MATTVDRLTSNAVRLRSKSLVDFGSSASSESLPSTSFTMGDDASADKVPGAADKVAPSMIHNMLEYSLGLVIVTWNTGQTVPAVSKGVRIAMARHGLHVRV